MVLLFILTIGYASFQTSLSLDAKGNVKKVTKYTTDDLKTLAVTSGDGLYSDTTEEGRYVYKGASPNNYITFSGSTYRIISVESDGTIKIIGDSIGSYIFDSTDNDWATASLQTTLNGDTYYNTLSDKDKVVSHTFNVGAVTYQSSTFDQTLEEDIEQEKATTWTGYVGLLNVSDYAKSNTNTSLCGTVNLNNYSAGNYSTCKSTTWLYTGSYYWTIAPRTDSSDTAWIVRSGGTSFTAATAVCAQFSICHLISL